jgi:hypothetical protein
MRHHWITGAPVVALAGLLPALATAQIPLPAVPSWTSNSGDYSTGGAVADVDGDGLLDFITSNGNDMDQDSNGIYFDSAGTLQARAGWRSADRGYFGHCYAGDVDNDGRPDLAVAYLGSGGSGDLRVRLYRNTGSTLETTPSWKASDQHSSFDVCLGDVDLDGDLDVCISAGDAYRSEIDSARIYRNNGGVLDTLPFWTAHDGRPGDAVRFADVDNDGDLDLFVGQVIPDSNRGFVAMYRNNAGVIEETPSWIARLGVGWVLRLAVGDYDNDGWLDLAAASNSQMGAANSIQVFHNAGGTLDTAAAYTMQRDRRYSSCVAWGDVDGDGYAELAAGGWWEPAVVYDNHAGALDTVPSWSWIPSNPSDLVCEALVFGSIGNAHVKDTMEAFSGNGVRKLFGLRGGTIQSVDSVKVNGVEVSPAGFCCDALVGWVSLAAAPPPGTDNIAVHYTRATHPDLMVTNWEPSYGNLMFRNSTPVSVVEGPARRPVRMSVAPNPSTGPVSIALSPAGTALGQVRIVDAAGRIVNVLPIANTGGTVVWDGHDQSGRAARPGIYFASAGNVRAKLIRLATD